MDLDDVVTTLLDAAGLCAVAVGAAALVLPLIGWAAVGVGGLVLLGGVRLAEALARRRQS